MIRQQSELEGMIDEMIRDLHARVANAGPPVLRMDDAEEVEDGMWSPWSIKCADDENVSIDLPMPSITDDEELKPFQTVHGSEFENWRPIRGYEAIWAPVTGAIEAKLCCPHGYLFGFEKLGPIRSKDTTISFANASDELMIWCSGWRYSLFPGPLRNNHHETSVRIGGPKLTSSAEAVTRLAQVGTGALLTLGTRHGIHARLGMRRYENTYFPSSPKSMSPDGTSVSCSDTGVDPVNRYLYAQTADLPMPLRFLAFYHVIEYYMVRGKEPAQVLDLLKCVGQGFLSTIRASAELERYYCSPNRQKVIQPGKDNIVNLNDSDSEVIESIAKRIYAIRNQIAHSKKPEKSIHQFSTGIADLSFDLQMLEALSLLILEGKGAFSP